MPSRILAWALAVARELLRFGARWCRERLLPKVLGFLAEIWQRFTLHRLRNLMLLLGLTAAGVAGLSLVPVAYGRAALAHAAGLAARRVRLEGEDRVLLALRYRAFQLGFTEAALDKGLFRLETGCGDEGPTCTVSYDFVHTVTFLGRLHLPVRIKDSVTRLQVEPAPDPMNDGRVRVD